MNIQMVELPKEQHSPRKFFCILINKKLNAIFGIYIWENFLSATPGSILGPAASLCLSGL